VKPAHHIASAETQRKPSTYPAGAGSAAEVEVLLQLFGGRTSPLVVEFGAHLLVPLQRRLLRCQFFSRTTAGDRVRLPVLINARCPHSEQTKMCGSGAAVGPTCPQFGHVIWVSIGARCYRHGERVVRE
jgi:hypothetical protein